MAIVPSKVLKVAGKFGSYGENGATFTPHLSDDGENITISYTNDKGLENPAPITFPKSALPKVTSDDNGKVLIAENGEIVFAEPPASVSSWNDLTDKPFGVEQAFEPIILPDMMDRSVSFDFGAIMDIGEMLFYKVNAPVLDANALSGATWQYLGVTGSVTKNDIDFDFVESYAIIIEGVEDNGDGTISSFPIWFIYIAHIIKENDYGVPIGLYVSDTIPANGNGVGTLKERMSIYKEIIKPLDEKHLPMDAIDARIEEYISEALEGDY